MVMEIESIFTESKWRIITELSHTSQSPTGLAKSTKTSLANISTQLRLLEALDFIEQEKLDNVEKGKPRKLFRLKKEFAYVILATKSVIGKKMFKLDDELHPFFSVLMINDTGAPYLLLKLFFKHENFLKDAYALGYLGMRGDELEVFIIHQNPEKFHGLHNENITRKDKTYKIRAHVHTKEAFEHGINNKEEYFTTLLKKVFIVVDKDHMLTNLKKGNK